MEIIEGIVLKQINYKESSKIIYVYSVNGLVSVLVHGSNKVKSPYLNMVRVFSHVKLFVSGKDLKTLRDGEIIDHNLDLSAELDKYTYSLHLMEIIYSFANHEHDHKKLFKFLLKIINEIKEKPDYELYIMMAELKLLFLLGIQPMLKYCVVCKSQQELSFSVNDGGMVCRQHKTSKVYGASTVSLLSKLYYFDLDKPIALEYSEKDLINLRLLIDDYYEYHLNYRSQSRKMLKNLKGF